MGIGRLLITGITGHSGSWFLKELEENKYNGEVYCIVRADSKTTLIDSSKLNIKKYVGDLNDKQFLKSCMTGINTVFHIAGIDKSIGVVDAAIQSEDVKRLFLVHTTGIYSKYKAASIEYLNIEKEVRRFTEGKVATTILRPTLIFGRTGDRNMEHFIKIIDNLKIIPMIAGGHNTIQPVYARDLGKAYYQALICKEDRLKDAYILSGECSMTLTEMYKIIALKLGKRPRIYVPIPMWLAYFGAVCIWLLTLGRINLREKVQRMGEDRSYPHDAASDDFGYAPTPFTNAIVPEIDEYKSNKIILGDNPDV